MKLGDQSLVISDGFYLSPWFYPLLFVCKLIKGCFTVHLKKRGVDVVAMAISYHNKILPNQEFYSDLYNNSDDYMARLFTLLQNHSSNISKDSFKINRHHRVDFEEMSTPPAQLAFLKFLIELTGTKSFLEIGTFLGSTSMHIANFIGSDADVVTIEKFDEFAELAKQNFIDNNMTDRIQLHVGDACEVIKTLPDNHFDFVYVDGDKGKYLELTQIAEQKISDRGLILVDDVLFHGDVLNDTPTTDKGRGCKAVLDYYQDTTEYSKCLLPLNNGILLLKKNPKK